MNATTCFDAVTGLLSRLWKTGPTAASLRPTADKLERPCRLYRRNRRATAAVEFAIVAPVFLLMVFGMIEYGRMVMVQQIITNAPREGARTAVLAGATTSSVNRLSAPT